MRRALDAVMNDEVLAVPFGHKGVVLPILAELNWDTGLAVLDRWQITVVAPYEHPVALECPLIGPSRYGQKLAVVRADLQFAANLPRNTTAAETK